MNHPPKKLSLDADLSDPGAIPENAITQAVTLMRTGRLHRYGEYSETEPHAALLEMEFAEYVGAKFAIGINSGGCAIFLGLKIADVKQGDKVLVNGFNLAPVPGAIQHAGAEAVLVEINDDYRINLDDLRAKADESQAKVLLLTHMRGHIANMNKVVEICTDKGLVLVEDCAHTMGAKWHGTFTGRFGQIGCFSTQTFKHINSGEGGILITDDEDMAAKAILYSGSYMLYGQHRSVPSMKTFEKWKKHIPNFSMRMSNLVACLLRSQLREISQRAEKWNQIYAWLEQKLNTIDGIEVPMREDNEEYVASSIQFHVRGLKEGILEQLIDRCTHRGVTIKWFGRGEPMGYTCQYDHWQYLRPQSLGQTSEILATTCDMRIPLSLTEEQCDTITEIIREEIALAYTNLSN